MRLCKTFLDHHVSEKARDFVRATINDDMRFQKLGWEFRAVKQAIKENVERDNASQTSSPPHQVAKDTEIFFQEYMKKLDSSWRSFCAEKPSSDWNLNNIV